jgi:hypothetical protein
MPKALARSLMRERSISSFSGSLVSIRFWS